MHETFGEAIAHGIIWVMLNWLKLSQKQHSGRLRPHEHTSYIPLVLILLVVGFALSVYTSGAESPPPEPSSISLTGTMPAKPPTVGATIKTPEDQKHTPTSPITISGTCPKNTLIEIFKNDIFAGSTTCSDNEKYSLDIDLLIGSNTLVARVYDALNQAGPDSKHVVVFYDALPSQAEPLMSLNFGGSQMLLNTDAVFRGVFPGQVLSMPIDIVGGAAPYAVNIQWGDSTNKVVPRSDSVGFTAEHTYAKPGTYQVTLQATDSTGRVAFLSVAAIVNGQPSITTTASISDSTENKLLVLWPLYVGSIAVVASFWLGERREKRTLRIRGLLSPT